MNSFLVQTSPPERMLKTSLEIARGLAALWVFIYHIRLGIDPGPLRSFANAGFLGVPAFFVISGYCMMASSRGIIARQLPAGVFLRRRLRRIFPPFWASILVVITVPFIAATIHGFRAGAIHWPVPRWHDFTVSDWLSLATLTKGLFWQGAAHKPYSAVNSVYWSLAIEVQFYLVMALTLVLRRRFHAVLMVVTAGSLAFWYFAGPIAPGLFPQYWPMFALGLLLYAALEKGFGPPRIFGSRSVAASAILVTLLLGFAVGITVQAPSESLGRQTIFAGLCCLILWASSGVEPVFPNHLAPARALTGLGKMSYSVYLLHIHLASLVSIGVAMLAPRNSVLTPILCIAGTLPLVYVFYQFCEKRYAGRPAK